MNTNNLYDVIGVGIGPFNLGLAALLDRVENINGLFFEQNSTFEWHPGMLLEGTVLNSPFLADLVTFADPTSPYTIINYLHKHNRLYQFYFNKDLKIPRKEYNSYAKWVANKLTACHFGYRVTDVEEIPEKECYKIQVIHVNNGEKHTYFTRHVVVGTGSTPLFPPGLDDKIDEDIYHSSLYGLKKERIKNGDKIMIVGSGQSAAEIFYDLLVDQKHYDYDLTWFTRSAGFYQSEAAKLAREVFSPDFINYFRSLGFDARLEALPELDKGRKGIEQETLMKIYELLYHRSIERKDPSVTLQPMTEIKDIKRKNKEYNIYCEQWQKGERFKKTADKVILATGYKPNIPKWITKMAELVWEDNKRYKVDDYYRLVFNDKRSHNIYTLTNLDHSHGTAATNLALSVLRNQTIINDMCGFEIYPLQYDTIFQQFSLKK
ncbi:lysine N(6)-hydroxylase/L-ornithine N(5)-oxygenase family protein [Alteribacillus sp. YIM 98480]|uniref:lysine N(6)-hydroxylase/L-ornithine N(5)-oxygenase family protein n=1 Tax=Alteribacillus sp. YIM 98480 TaxID=2606599 RepID=UPI00131B5ADE|nr:SidA/IucD/PvdA family monooxygenase [Alteribacillus sp. YIM 98480]